MGRQSRAGNGHGFSCSAPSDNVNLEWPQVAWPQPKGGVLSETYNGEMAGSGSLVWHYTDGGGLKGILEDRVLWASSAAFLNDFKELISGNDVLNKLYGELKDEFAGFTEDIRKLLETFPSPREENFILSASEDPDSLTMWRYYGQDQVSFAVGLDKSVGLSARAQKRGHAHPFPPPRSLDSDEEGRNQRDNPAHDGQIVEPWEAMVYDPIKQKEILTQALSDLRDALEVATRDRDRFHISVHVEKLSLLSELNRIKDNGFHDEKELRILAQVSPAWKYVIHRAGRYGMLPYIEVGIPRGGTMEPKRDFAKDGRQEMERLPIRQINIGPTPFREEAKFGLQQLLNCLGYHDVKVAVSTIPYR